MKIATKEGVDFNDLKDCHDNLWFATMQISKHLEIKKLPFTITSIRSDRDNVKAKSNTHQTGRAIDIRIRDWTPEQAQEIWLWMSIEFRHIGARVACESVPALLKKDHIHFQVRP
jgi:hypothetical protein